MSKVIIKNHFSPSEDCTTYNIDPSLAKQEFKDDADLNVVMKRMTKGQTLEHLEVHQGNYGFASPLDLHQAMNTVARANSMFEDLPSGVRNEFENEPAKFLDFVQNPDNVDRARELGIGLSTEAQAIADQRAAEAEAAEIAAAQAAVSPGEPGAVPSSEPPGAGVTAPGGEQKPAPGVSE